MFVFDKLHPLGLKKYTIAMPVHMSIHIFMHKSMHCISLCVPTHMSMCNCIHMSTYISMQLSTYTPAHTLVYTNAPIDLPTCMPSCRTYVCLSYVCILANVYVGAQSSKKRPHA